MKFLCDQCKAKYQIADEKVAGRTVRMKCRKCGHMIEVRAEVTESSVARPAPRPDEPRSSGGLATSLSATRPSRTSVAPGALAGAFQRRIQDDDDEKTMMGPAPSASHSSAFEASVTEEWYAAINGLPVGPMRLSELRTKASSGAINDDTLVWQEGFEEWRPVKTITQLAAIVREAAPAKALTGHSSPPTPVAPSAPRAAVTRPSAARQTAPLGPAPAALRSNVVPISRGSGHGAAAAVAHAPSHSSVPAAHAAASLAPAVAAAPASNPFAGVDPFAPPAPLDPFAFPPPGTDIDPYAAPPAPISVVSPYFGPASAPAASGRITPAPPSVEAPASVPPPAQRSMAPLLFVAAVVLAAAFGVTAAVMTFKTDAAAKAAPSATAAPTDLGPTIAAPTETISAPSPSTSSSHKVASNSRPPGSAAAAASAPPKSGGAVNLGALGLATGGSPTAAKTDIPGAGGAGPGGAPLDTASVTRTINNYKAAVKRKCWDNASESAPSANISVAITVASNGSVSSASGTGDPPAVARCVENHVRGWHFDGTGKVVIPFHFVRQ